MNLKLLYLALACIASVESCTADEYMAKFGALPTYDLGAKGDAAPRVDGDDIGKYA